MDLSNISDISPWARPKKIALLKITAAKIPGSDGYHLGHTSALHIRFFDGKKWPGLPRKIHRRTIHKREVMFFSITNNVVFGGNYVNSKNKQADAAKFVLKWRL